VTKFIDPLFIPSTLFTQVKEKTMTSIYDILKQDERLETLMGWLEEVIPDEPNRSIQNFIQFKVVKADLPTSYASDNTYFEVWEDAMDFMLNHYSPGELIFMVPAEYAETVFLFVAKDIGSLLKEIIEEINLVADTDGYGYKNKYKYVHPNQAAFDKDYPKLLREALADVRLQEILEKVRMPSQDHSNIFVPGTNSGT